MIIIRDGLGNNFLNYFPLLMIIIRDGLGNNFLNYFPLLAGQKGVL